MAVSGDFTGVTGTAISSCGEGSDVRDVWFSYTPAVSGSVTVTWCEPGNFNYRTVSVFDACGGAELGCREFCSTNPPFSVTMTAGHTYLIRVAADQSPYGGYRVQVSGGGGSCPADTCDLAGCIAGGETVVASSALAHHEGVVSGCAADGIDVWYRYTPRHTGPVTIDTCGAETDFDTTLAVYDGCGGAELACNDDACPGYRSSLQVSLTTGQTYLIRVSGFENETGRFALHVSEGEGACPLYAESFESNQGGYAMSSYWHRSQSCLSTAPGHSRPGTLFFGRDFTCVVESSPAGNADSPLIHLQGTAYPFATFRYYLDSAAGNPLDDDVEVQLVDSADDAHALAANLPGVAPVTLADPSAGWRQAAVDLTPYAGQDVRLRFRYDTLGTTDNLAPGFYVDDLQVFANACHAPAAPQSPSPADSATQVPVSGASLTWDGGPGPDACPTLWDVELGPAGGPLAPLCSGRSSPSCALPPLEPATTYAWRVTARPSCTCGSTVGPTWSFQTYTPHVLAATRIAANPSRAASVRWAVTFSEAVTGADVTDFCLTTTGGIAGAAVSSVTGSGAMRTVTVATGSGDGTIQLNLCDDDSIVNGAQVPLGGPGQGNGDFTQGEAYTIDKTRPTVLLATPAATTGQAPIPVTATFSEPVTGFALSDLILTGATASDLQGGPAVYTFDLQPTVASGTVTVKVSGGAASDAAGNNSVASNLLSVLYDPVPPAVVAMARVDVTPSNRATVRFAVTFSESVSGVDAGDFVVTVTGDVAGAAVSAVNGSGSSRTVSVATGTGDGSLRLDLVDDDSVHDVALNPLGGPGTGNGDFTGPVYDLDKTRPSVVLASPAPSPTGTSPIPVTVTFSEPVTGFEAADITVTNGSVSGFAGGGASYGFDLVPAAPGRVTARVAAGKADDAASNHNTASNTLTRTYAP